MSNDFCYWSTGLEIPDEYKAKWRWYVFGGKGTKHIPISVDLLESSWWHRTLTRIVFRSQWERLR